jgi:hypothetical protein
MRSALPLRGTIVDAATGAVLTPLAHDGPANELWTVDLPPNDGNLMLLTMHQLPAAAAP